MTATAAAVVTRSRTCTLDQLSAYTAAFTNPAFTVQRRENVKTADKLGHSFKVQQHNETQHWNKCSRCNEIDGKENHTGGTALCTVKAECGVCHVQYGEAAADNHSGLEKVEGISATAAATGLMEHWRCNACGRLFADAAGKNEITSSDTVLRMLAPSIIEGMNVRWTKGSEEGLIFKSDAAFVDFIEVLVDGTAVSTDSYTVREGSIIVELKADCLASLAGGGHTITIRSTGGDAATGFTVEEVLLPAEAEATGVQAWEIAAAAALGVICIIVVVFVIRKKKTA